ncbi:DNA-directed RNA polymerase subunit beta', partial [Candidatus Falkowbacteria bacterium RIFOXYB2_FULL_35_7]
MGEALKISDFDSIRLKLASPDDIRSWSHGEVTRPETINYRTQKPEKDGLFCEKIFGPSKDWECYCGKYKKIRYKGIVCDKCGVEVTRSVVRRQRMGHIDLASPVTHIWFLRGVPSKIGLVLDMSVQKLEKVIYFASFIVTEIDEEAKKEELDNLQKEYRSKMKNIEGQHKQKLNVLESADLKSKERKDELKKLESWHLNEEEDLKENFSSAEKELKDLKVLSIISESQFHDLSLRYGHVFEAGIGAEAIYKLLQRFDLEKTVLALESEIEHDEKGTKKKKIINRVKLLKSLFKNNLKPEWTVLNAVPVIPPDLRPMVPLDGGRFATSDLNDLYRRIISRNNRLKRLAELNAPEVICRNEKRMLQEAVDALIDNSARHTKTTTASTGQKRSLKSIADYLKGKQGRFRQNLLGKRIDYSGRSVIVVGPNLTLDQCGLPKKMALELFKPFVISRLIKEEYVHNIRSANRFIEADRPEVWDILEDIIKSALVMLNRAPTLHRLGIQAFRPILIEGKAIQLHPLVCSAFNADFDGDQMAVHVPLTEEAKQEARDLMLSTNNLLKPATGNPIATPSLDMVWGCYYVTLMREDQPKPIKTFADVEEAKLAYALRKISLRDKILIKVSNNKVLRGKVKQDMLETCLGRILFNELLPDKVDFFNEEVDKKRMGAIIKLCLEQYTFVEVAGVLDRVKNFGYKQLTKAGFSWGMKDTPEVKGKTELVDEGNGRVEVINEQFNNGLLTPDERYTKVIETWTDVKDRVTALTKDALDKNGPVYTMINSGSRGSWGQLTQMMGMKGLVTNPAGQIIELPVKANFREGFSVLEYYISSHGSRKGLTDTALRTAGAGYLTRRLVDVAQDVIVVKEDCGDTEGKIFTKEESEQMNQTLIERIVGRYLLSDIKDAKGKAIVKKGEVITDEIARKLDKLELDSANVRSVLSCKLPRGVCRKCYGFDLAYNREVKMGTAVGIIAAQSIGEPGTQLTMRTFHTGGVAGGDDITQGLPRVEEVFEARSPKKKALLSEVGGKVSIVEQPRTIKGPKGDIIARTSFGEKIIKVSYENKEDEVHKFKDISALKLKVKDGDLVKDNDVLYVDANKKKVKTGKSGTIRLSDKELVVSGTVQMEREYVIPAGTVLWVRDGVEIEKGDQLTEGSLALEQLYKLKGRQAVEKYILKEIQYIYKSQGQPLNDKHVETIVKQMFSRVYVEDPGDTNLLEGEIVEYSELIEENQKTAKEKGRL